MYLKDRFVYTIDKLWQRNPSKIDLSFEIFAIFSLIFSFQIFSLGVSKQFVENNVFKLIQA